MPTQDFTDVYDSAEDLQLAASGGSSDRPQRSRSERGSLSVRVAWDFSYENVFLSVAERTFQLHDIAELRTNGVRVPTKDGELFVFLANTREGERFQVSVDEHPLHPDGIDFANAMSPNRPVVMAHAISANRPAPSRTRWEMQERIESARRWCRVVAALAAALAFILSARFPTSQLQYRRQSLIWLVGFAAFFVTVDLLSRTDLGARIAMIPGTIAVIPAILTSCLAYWRFHVAGLNFIDPKSCVFPFLLFGYGALGRKTFLAHAAGTWLHRDAKDRRRRS
jgi:hypothetical protein